MKAQETPGESQQPSSESKPLSWWEFIESASDLEIATRVGEEATAIAAKYAPRVGPYCFLSLYEPRGSLGSWESNRIYTALKEQNPKREKDVLIFVVSRGGSIESAYQISKVAKAFSPSKFVVALPRFAKSAATLLALGADQIHMGTLGELGPIDPQLGNLPALGVKRALETIASICAQYPKSSDVFSKYLSQTVTIEQIGYCERVGESAVQYAERLLNKKDSLRTHANKIAKQLVYEYKDHSFVIDLEEARELLGTAWIIADSPELDLAEEMYQLFEGVNMLLGLLRKKRLVVVGTIESGALVLDNK